jgi:leucyl/phenylalanyl-tRNA--protein transferase
MSVESELKKIFSDPHQETMDGVLVVGGRLSPELLISSYHHGIFPWPHEGYPMLWFCPDERGVIEFSELHIPRSFQKWLNRHADDYVITMNRRFSEVVQGCKTQVRAGQSGTWITGEVENAYTALFDIGHAFSLEVQRDGKLVGGIYGVQSQKYFSCESMFHLEDNVSKLALLSLIRFLQRSGHSWLDIQMVTPVCASFGGKLISKKEFLKKIGF